VQSKTAKHQTATKEYIVSSHFSVVYSTTLSDPLTMYRRILGLCQINNFKVRRRNQ